MGLRLLLLWTALIAVLVLVVMLASGEPPSALWLAIALGGALGLSLFAHRTTQSVRLARQLQRAASRLAAGDLDEAEALLVQPSRPRFHLAFAQIQAVIALRRGAFDRALDILEASLAKPATRAERAQRLDLSARALRALLLARLDRSEEARADTDAVWAARDEVEPVARARAGLARGILAARAGDKKALAQLLREARPLMLSALAGRERMLARALSSFATGGAPSAYRSPDPERNADEELAAWVGAFVPETVPFVPAAGRRAEPAALPPASASARAALEVVHARRAKAPGHLRNAVVAALAIVACGGAAAVVAPMLFAGASGPLAGALVVVAGLPIYATLRYMVERSAWRALFRGLPRVSAGAIDEAREIVAPHTRAPEPTRAGAAFLHLSCVELAAGRPALALELVERSMALLQGARRGSGDVTALFYDQARQQRAIVLVLLGRDDEAAAELETLDARDAEATRFTVALLRAARDGAFERAAALVQSRHLSLSTREVMLGHVAGVCANLASKPERELVQHELALLPHIAGWLRAVLPQLWRAYQAVEPDAA